MIVGAGGWVFPMELARDILSFGALAHGELVLYDIDVEAAERTAGRSGSSSRSAGSGTTSRSPPSCARRCAARTS